MKELKLHDLTYFVLKGMDFHLSKQKLLFHLKVNSNKHHSVCKDSKSVGSVVKLKVMLNNDRPGYRYSLSLVQNFHFKE